MRLHPVAVLVLAVVLALAILCIVSVVMAARKTITCSVEGCRRTHLAKGMCRLHYVRSRHGRRMDAPYQDHGNISVKLRHNWYCKQLREKPL